MKFQIIGDNTQTLLINLMQNEEIHAEAGSMLYYRGDITMSTKAQGGLLKSMLRALFTRGSILMKIFSCNSSGEVAFAAPMPGKIIHIKMKDNEIICRRDVYLCSAGKIKQSLDFEEGLNNVLFGGGGVNLLKFSGNGDLFLHSGGDFLEIELQEGEIAKVDIGCILMIDSKMNYVIEYVGTFLEGRETYLVNLTGPGKIILQTHSLLRLAQELIKTNGNKLENTLRGGEGGGDGGGGNGGGGD